MWDCLVIICLPIPVFFTKVIYFIRVVDAGAGAISGTDSVTAFLYPTQKHKRGLKVTTLCDFEILNKMF